MKGMTAMTEFPTSRTAAKRRNAVPAAIIFAFALTAVTATAQEQVASRKETRIDMASGGAVNIVNNSGTVSLKLAGGHQLLVAYTLHSNKVEVDQESTSDKRRVEIRTHALSDQRATADEARVDYEISVPAGVMVTVATSTAPITAEGLSGDIALESDTGQITVSNIARSHLHVHSVAGAVQLSNVNLGSVDVSTTGGAVRLTGVNGPKVKIASGSGNITYEGDCSGAGDYVLMTHSGNIDVTLPQTASVDLTARSASGGVENDFPLQAKKHSSFVPKAGSSFAGTSNSGSSSVELRSFSGKIRVKKQ
jgi:DUF4097 and DUF4098 domain-containing protein YvlB